MPENPEILHQPGECPSGDKTCNGVGTYGEDPYQSEIHDDHTEFWMCEGELAESVNAI